MSWLPIPENSDFTLRNLPFGVFTSPTTPTPRPATAIGDYLLDLHAFSTATGFSSLGPELQEKLAHAFSQRSLNAFAALGQGVHRDVHRFLQQLLAEDGKLKHDAALQSLVLRRRDEVEMVVPMEIGDYTDFYAGRVHAFNVGSLFRGPQNALQVNYEQLPVGYHGRSSSVVVSGTSVRRPWGQTAEGVMQPCARLDLELEMAAFVAIGNRLGETITVKEARENIFGFVLMNDWSARDIQAFEYIPLGPFTSKNFGTTISPWIVLPCALEPFLAPPIPRLSTTPLQPYLVDEKNETVYNAQLTVRINDTTLTKTSGKNLLWSFPQMMAHHTVTGCNLRTGDLIGSGTISGEGEGEAGCLLEATRGGKKSVAGGKMWLEDGDEVVIEGFCGSGAERVGWGECKGRVMPARGK